VIGIEYATKSSHAGATGMAIDNRHELGPVREPKGECLSHHLLELASGQLGREIQDGADGSGERYSVPRGDLATPK
jgi:hypothetical protein